CSGARSCHLNSSPSIPTARNHAPNMAKAARRYDLYLPLTSNDGRPFPDDLFEDVQRRLLDRFGGLTAQQREFPLQGIWQGGTRLYLDLVIIMTALDFRREGSGRFIA